MHERRCTSSCTSNPYIHIILNVANHLRTLTQYWCQSAIDSVRQLKFSLPQQWQDASFTFHSINWQSKSHSTSNGGQRKFCISVGQTMSITYYQYWIFHIYWVLKCAELTISWGISWCFSSYNAVLLNTKFFKCKPADVSSNLYNVDVSCSSLIKYTWNYCNKGQQCLVVWRSAKPLMSRLTVCQCLRGKDRVPDAYRRLTGSESNIRETQKWHTRPAFSRGRTFVSWQVSVLHIADSECGRQSEGTLYLQNCIIHCVVEKWICGELCLRPVSVL
jgi:hypothetical protein